MLTSKIEDRVWGKLNEGLGGCYERIAFTNIMKRLMLGYKCESMLELNATYIAGVPGFNSVIFAQEGYDVTIAVRPRDYEDTLKAWDLVNQRKNIQIIELNSDLETPFENGQFDIVWNHLALDQYKNPVPMVKEMARISNKLVLNLTLAPYNYGFFLHRLLHKIEDKAYDHGYWENATIGAMERFHQKAGLIPIASGGVDCPPWMDTVDQQIAGSMTYADSYGLRDAWIWCSANPKCRNSKLIELIWSWEEILPIWFKILMSHHLYVASIKS